LTVENTVYDLNVVQDWEEGNYNDDINELRFCVFDAADDKTSDWYWVPLVFLESFYSPAICLKIGEHNIQVPLDWSVMICDSDLTALEVIPLASLNNRGFQCVTINPFTSNKPESAEIKITNIYQDVKWYTPKIKPGHILAVPLTNQADPLCAFFVKEVNKVSPNLELSDLF
jgi:hypothetical protein